MGFASWSPITILPRPRITSATDMPKAKRAMERFEDMNVELILGGHLHRAYTPWVAGFLSGESTEIEASSLLNVLRHHEEGVAVKLKRIRSI